MGKLRRLSGRQACAILADHGFAEARQSGSHLVMQIKEGERTVTVVVPLHSELAIGTLSAIIRQSGLPRTKFEA